MSLVTRCTACGTLFKVVADQLKISEGWVRCGQCAVVFDAQAHLVPDYEAQAGDDQAPSSPSNSNSFTAGQLRAAEELEDDVGPSTTSWANGYDSQLTSMLPEENSDMAAALPATPSFMKKAQRAALWRSPAARTFLGIACVILLAGLALQIVLHERDRIAAMHASAKPWLEGVCQLSGCQVMPFKRLEAITVDASSFNRVSRSGTPGESPGQSYKLSLTLKNSGTLPVAVPHVELSLQDALDQPMLRRVLSPAELGLSAERLAPAQDLVGQVTLQVDTLQLPGSRVQGYRVLAFYP
jgi:predicted Zn finger-like uncharacterized protein